MDSPIDDSKRHEHLQPSVLVVAVRVLALLFIFDGMVALAIFGFFSLGNVHEWHNAYIGVLLFANVIKYVILSYMVIKLFADWAGRGYYLSGHHLIERLGLINITETTHELSRVTSVVVKQSWLGRYFNYGTISLSLAGSGGQHEIVLRDINNPKKYRDYFDQHLQAQG